ncbi:MAG: hypothetical protein MRERV_25c003 [Mycoplasmataceae bacterium RV_VA103A]|nr:MAG: hypothetical protein MRERV_25c003 [Mycoplasmataceae bacterium RV_VA103A]
MVLYKNQIYLLGRKNENLWLSFLKTNIQFLFPKFGFFLADFFFDRLFIASLSKIFFRRRYKALKHRS